MFYRKIKTKILYKEQYQKNFIQRSIDALISNGESKIDIYEWKLPIAYSKVASIIQTNIIKF